MSRYGIKIYVLTLMKRKKKGYFKKYLHVNALNICDTTTRNQ